MGIFFITCNNFSTHSSTMTSQFMHLVRPTVAAPAATLTTGACSVKIHASAVFQILEIVLKQALPQNKRVIGTLLGIRSDDGSEFEIRDAFMVTCTETGDLLAIDEHTHKQMYQLYKKAHPKELVLGWFGSLNTIDSTTALIHDFYSKGTDRAFPYPAIYLNVDFLVAGSEKEGQETPATVKSPEITTYIGAAVKKLTSSMVDSKQGWKALNSSLSYIFTPIPNQVIERTVCEKLVFNSLKEAQVNQQNSVTVAGVDHELSQLTRQLEVVDGQIDALLKFISVEKNNNSDRNIDLLRLLSNKLLSKPQLLLNLSDLSNKFGAHNQDVIMIELLTKAVKEQIELSARLTAEADKK